MILLTGTIITLSTVSASHHFGHLDCTAYFSQVRQMISAGHEMCAVANYSRFRHLLGVTALQDSSCLLVSQFLPTARKFAINKFVLIVGGICLDTMDTLIIAGW